MRTLAIALAILTLSAAAALAEDLAVSESTLNSMGLADMQALSDLDGQTIRGKGFFEDFFGENSGFPEFTFELPSSTNPPANNPPTNSQPESPFDFSPFGGKSLLGNFQGGSPTFGSGPAVGGNSMGFNGSFPWPL